MVEALPVSVNNVQNSQVRQLNSNGAGMTAMHTMPFATDVLHMPYMAVHLFDRSPAVLQRLAAQGSIKYSGMTCIKPSMQ